MSIDFTQRVVTYTIDAPIKIYTQYAFADAGTSGLLNVSNRIKQFKEGVLPTSDTLTLFSDISANTFAVWLVPMIAHKYIHGLTLDPSGGVATPLDQDLITMVQCNNDALARILTSSANRAAVLTALKALPAYTATTSAGQAQGTYNPFTVAYIIETPNAAHTLWQLDLQVYGTA